MYLVFVTPELENPLPYQYGSDNDVIRYMHQWGVREYTMVINFTLLEEKALVQTEAAEL